MQQLLSTSIPPVWTSIRVTRASVGQALAQYPPEVARAAMMTASELLENAMKYGEEVPGALRILFTLSSSKDRLQIETANGSADLDSVGELRERVRRVQSAPNKEALYIGRLEELLADPSQNAKLGLYRIAFEGGFDLDCRYQDAVVTVTATRRIP